jgi:hypothetical protein
LLAYAVPILEPPESRWDDQAIHRSPLINTTTSAARAMKAHRLAAAASSGIPPAVTIDVLDDSRY